MSRLLVALFATFVFAVEAGACSCLPAGSVEAEYEHADIVFAGVVVSIEDPRGDRVRALPEHERKVTFRVMQWWKGDTLPDSVELWTGYGGGDCGYPVEVAKSYLVYARRDSRNRLAFGICGRTAALICASKDLEELGDPVKTYETFGTASLVKREEPYTTYWRPCIEWPVLLGERGLRMDKHCRFKVEGVVTRDGTVRDFAFIDTSLPQMCPSSLRDQIAERVATWRFLPAMFEGHPIESLLTSISMREPVTEAEHAKWLQEQAERAARKKPD